MAQLKDLLVSGPSRLIGKLFANEAQLTTLNIPTTSGGTTYGPGTNNQVLTSNGTTVYWASGFSGNANTATALTSNAGSGTQPIYFSGGKPVATTYALHATVNSGTTNYMAYYSSANAVSGTSNARIIDGCLNLYPANGSYREGMRIHPTGGWSDIVLMGNTNTNTSSIAATDWFIGNNSGTFYITHAGSSSSTTGYLKASTENSAGYWQFYQRVGINGISNTYNLYVNGTSYLNGVVTVSGYLALSTNINASAADNGTSSTQYPTTFNILDNAGRIINRLESVVESNGNIGTYWYVRNYNTSGAQVAQKGIKFVMDKSGALTYTISDPDKFRAALDLNATINTGTTNHLTYYSGTNSIAAGTNVSILNNYQISNSRNDATVDIRANGLRIWGQTYGNTANQMLSNTAGVFRFSDGGPQIIFNTSDTWNSQAGALIFTDHDTAATGTSFHFVTTEGSDNNGGNCTVTAPRFRARRGLTVGQNSDNTSYQLYVNGTSYLKGNTTITGILEVTAQGNTFSIGSQNTSYNHLYNSANIPFIFNNTILTIKGDLGNSTYPFNNLYIGKGGTKGIYYVGTKNTYQMITFVDNEDDVNGNGIKIGGGGVTVVGSGESAANLSVSGGSEVLYLLSDGAINVEANAQTIANRLGFQVTTAGAIVPVKAEAANNNAQDIGTSSNKWKNIYATTFTGNLAGNASTADSATSATSATTASKLGSADVGSATQPIYLDDGTPKAATAYSGLLTAFSLSTNTLSLTVGGTTKTASAVSSVANAWTGGTSAGPSLKVTVNGVAATAAAIPSASASASGIITTGAQTIAGAKTLSSTLTIKGLKGTSNTDYGTALPSSGSEGQIFFQISDETYEIPAGGTTGQALIKNSNTDRDVKWGPVGGQQTPNNSTKFYPSGSTSTSANTGDAVFNTSVYVQNSVLFGAAWNDYAEYRETTTPVEAGRVVVENGDDTLSLSTERMQPGAEIVSDTFGFAIGQTEKSKTAIAASGRVLAYPHEPRRTYKPGQPVCSGPNGTVSQMTDEEARMYPWCIIGTVSSIPEYDTWGEENIQVNGRIWIRIR